LLRRKRHRYTLIHLSNIGWESKSMTRRVVITGMGLISPLGSTPAELGAALAAGRSGVGPLAALPSEPLPSAFAAEARGFTGHIDDFGELEGTLKRNIKKNLKIMCREIAMGVASAQRALAHAGLSLGKYQPDRTGCVYGSDHIMTAPEEFSAGIAACRDASGNFQFGRWGDEGLKKVEPLWLLKYLPNMPGSHIAIYNDLRGPSNSITLREASGNLAIGEALSTIQRGAADAMVAGATGTRVHCLRTIHVVLQEEIAHGDSPEKLSRPFDKNRNGAVLGEGAGAVVLEELEFAQKRGATIYGEVVGAGSSTVLARDFTPRRDTALANVMRQALRAAKMTPEQIGHIHAHGLATKASDRDEAKAIVEIFGADASKTPVAAAKSYFGNLGAASGVVELIGSLLFLQEGRLFPTLNYETPDPECPLAIARVGKETPAGDSFLNLNVTPLGQASAVLVRKWS
jgi:3-oxoacyl-[acyl-carrier-protein] synthase II